ncbi:MAG: site-specific DNA-methyltransferase [Bacteroidales bacterium]|nr:site-specific DNA-methyltransferase [Bacteroidales bacterium]
MEFFSENSIPLQIKKIQLHDIGAVTGNNAFVILLPKEKGIDLAPIYQTILNSMLDESALITVGHPEILVEAQILLKASLRYQSWIAIRERNASTDIDSHRLENSHFGALIHSKYKNSLKHCETRLKYTICPFCGKTTKDYGGKKHTFHEFGTLISDVWKEISLDYSNEDDINKLLSYFALIFGLQEYSDLIVLDYRQTGTQVSIQPNLTRIWSDVTNAYGNNSLLIKGDCIEELKKIPDNSIDFIFADPPYNVNKKYVGYNDGKAIEDYFNWCDEWLLQLARVLKPHRTLAVLNIPLWSIRHFEYLKTILNYQNWIVWDGLSFPVRQIMPAHYSILCFTKGESRVLPKFAAAGGVNEIVNASKSFKSLKPLKAGYCLRESCINKRSKVDSSTREIDVSDIWWDIHRLKHNSRRVDHPCQLPPALMYRLISIFSDEGEIVLDCFNGAGTTTLCAQQLNRMYIGIEASDDYHAIAQKRHDEILNGLDPFRKEPRKVGAKNSRVPRMEKNTTGFTKKEIQLDVRNVALVLGHIPTKEEYKTAGKYPIDIVDRLFQSWSDACVATKTNGVTEYPKEATEQQRTLEFT